MNFDPSNYNELTVTESPIPGLFVVKLPVHGDNRGWFKENYQKEKMEALGLPSFTIVQNNISFNDKAGATRGLHAEPWNKFISTANGRVFGAWCDLRKGDSFGRVFTHEINPGTAIFVPKGVANGYQALDDNIAYTYLVDAHWSPDAKYTFVNLFDPALGIDWPISQDQAIISEKDAAHPLLTNVIPIVGANGQLGRALRQQYPEARFADIDEMDITDRQSVESFDWSGISIVLNAAAFTNVDGAETPEGRVAAWKVNASAVANLTRVCRTHNMTLVHISSDYVFDGTKEPHFENEDFSPLSVYGASKAAGDLLVEQLDNFYLLRTTWVIGEGKNFVRTMLGLAEKNISPTVVHDQIGRLTFTRELVRIIDHLLSTQAPFGTYNATNDGPLESWADITRRIFELAGRNDLTVTNTTTAEYFAGKDGIAPRPLGSDMSLDKLHSIGFTSHDWTHDLKDYILN